MTKIIQVAIFILIIIGLLLSLKTFPVYAAEPKNFIGFGVDPNNSGGNPDTSFVSQTGVGLVRLVYKDDTNTQTYIQSSIDKGTTPVTVLDWESTNSVWTDGSNVDSAYIEKFVNDVVKSAVTTYGDKAIYEIWNEPDGTAGTVHLSPEQYAALLTASYDAIKAIDPDAIVITAGFVSGDLSYADQVIKASGGTLAADGIGIHPYVDPSKQTIEDVKNLIKSYAALSGTPVWITEFGWETKDLQKQAEWLLQVMNLTNDSDTKNILQAVMWYAFSDAMKDGFGLVDANGNLKPAFQYLLEFLKNPLNADLLAKIQKGLIPIPFLSITPTPKLTITPTPPPFICSASDQTPGFYRPAPCENCGEAVELPVNSCAESFTARQDTYFYLNPDDEDASEVKMCKEGDAYAYFKRDWSGQVTIDTSKTTVPFAGYHDKIDNQEAKYLAQYFAGSLALRGPKNADGTEEQRTEISNESGVLAKVLPPEELNKIRCTRINKALGNSNENYQVPYKNNPNLPTPKKLTEFAPYANRVPCYKPTVKVEDNPALWKQWDNDMVTWMQTDYAKLWPYIPLTTLKDAPGTLDMTIQHKPGTLSVTQAQLTFPHLASLYESTQELWSWLVPVSDNQNTSLQQANSTQQNYLTNANSKTTDQLNEELDNSNSFCGLQQDFAAIIQPKIILAQSSSSHLDNTLETECISQSNGSCFLNFKVTPSNEPGYDFAHPGYSILVDGVVVYHQDGDSSQPSYSTGTVMIPNPNNPTYNGLFINLTPGQTVEITFAITDGSLWNFPDGTDRTFLNRTLSCTVGADGQFTNCKITTPTVTPAPSKKCGNPDSYTPSDCNISDAMTDINPNDYICSNPYPLVTTLDAKDYRVTFSEGQYNLFKNQVNRCVSSCESKSFCDRQSTDYDGHECSACKEACRWVKLSKYSAVLMNRKIGLDLQIPYLEKIGIYTTRGEGKQPMGIFDIFRPAGFAQYDYKDAKSNISYTYHGFASSSEAPNEISAINNSRADPNSGYLYYPWLGGIEMAKQCVSKVILQPESSADKVINSEYCPKLIGTN